MTNQFIKDFDNNFRTVEKDNRPRTYYDLEE